LVSPGTRFVASEAKATKRPSAEILEEKLVLSAWAALEATLTRSIGLGQTLVRAVQTPA
jgi:hypothetical protein